MMTSSGLVCQNAQCGNPLISKKKSAKFCSRVCARKVMVMPKRYPCPLLRRLRLMFSTWDSKMRRGNAQVYSNAIVRQMGINIHKKGYAKYRAYRSGKLTLGRENLDDWYIKRIFSQCGVYEPSDEQIAEKRMSIKLKRIIYEKQREINA